MTPLNCDSIQHCFYALIPTILPLILCPGLFVFIREIRKCVFCSESFAAGKISGRLMLGQTGVVSHRSKNSGESVIVHSLVQMWNNVL